MALPTLTPQEIATMQAEKLKQETIRDGLIEAKASKISKISELTDIDSVFKKFFDYYHINIVNSYDLEYQNLNGRYFPAGNISESDLILSAEADGSGRLTPILPNIDINRIPEFDGGNTGVTSNNESSNSARVAELLGIMQNGINGVSNTATTTAAVTPTSTEVNISQPTAITLSVGQNYKLQGSGFVAIIRITVLKNVATVGLNQTGTIEFVFVLAPTGTLPSGRTFDTFAGFSNTDRTNKTTSNQEFMDALLVSLGGYVDNWEDNAETQVIQLGLNEDDLKTSQNAAALVNANAARSFISNYRISLDISNTGIASVTSFISTRNPQITARVAEIIGSYSSNYYDERYNYANMRANTSNGSLRSVKVAESTISTLDDMIASAQAAVDAINSILP